MIHYLSRPLEDDLPNFITSLQKEYAEGSLSDKQYYVSLGKALAYAECRYSSGRITMAEAAHLIYDVKVLIYPEREEAYRYLQTLKSEGGI